METLTEKKEIGTTINPDGIYSTEEAMTLLKIKSKTTIRTRVKEGRLRRSQQGRREIYFLGKDLIDFISNGRN